MSEVASRRHDLIKLADRPGTEPTPGTDGTGTGTGTGTGRSLRVRILGRHTPGTPAGDDRLDCEITVTADSVRGQFLTAVTHHQLRQWEDALERLARGCAVRWLDEEHGPELRIEPGRPGGLWVTVSDAEESGVTLRLALSPAPEWPEEQRALLKLVREAYPPGAVDAAPGDPAGGAHPAPGD